MEIVQAHFRQQKRDPEQLIGQAHALMQQVEEHLSASIQSERKVLAARIWRLRQRSRHHAQAQAQQAQNLSLAAQIQNLNREHSERLKNSQKDLLALVLKYTEQLTGSQVSKDCSGLTKKIQSALKLLGQEQTVRITVHPDHRDEIQQQLGNNNKTIVEDNSNLGFGAAELITRIGRLRIDWRSELATLREKLGF